MQNDRYIMFIYVFVTGVKGNQHKYIKKLIFLKKYKVYFGETRRRSMREGLGGTSWAQWLFNRDEVEWGGKSGGCKTGAKK